jgi:hypothetical protein
MIDWIPVIGGLTLDAGLSSLTCRQGKPVSGWPASADRMAGRRNKGKTSFCFLFYQNPGKIFADNAGNQCLIGHALF